MTLRPGPVAAVLLLVGLGGWAYWSEFRGAAEKKKAEEAKDKVVVFDRAALKAIVLKNGAASIRLEREGEGFALKQPVAAAADKEAVDGLLSGLESARVERRLEDAKDRKSYGLDPPAASITLENGTGPGVTIEVGDANPIGGTTYALPPGAKEVAVVSGSIGEAAKKDLFALRDKALLAFDPWKIKSLEIDRGRESLSLEKLDDGWAITAPLRTPADGPTVTDLLTAAERVKATRFVTDQATDADMKQYGLDPAAARLSLLQEGWDTRKTILFGAEAEGQRYARTVGKNAIVTVPSDIWPKLATSMADLRRKEVLGLSQYRIQSISIAIRGNRSLVLSRQKEGGWSASGRATGAVKKETVDTFLRSVADLKALSFEDAPKDADRDLLARSPEYDMTLEQEPDSDGSAAKREHLLVGAARKDGRVPIRDLAWAPVALVPAAGVEALRKNADALITEASAPPAAPKEEAKPAAPPAGAPSAPSPGTPAADATPHPPA